MRGNTLGGFDRFRLPAALLVVAIHTGPLLSVSPLANDLLTDIWGRIAVPFFFAVSGWFLVPRLRREGAAALGPFLKKTLLLYLLSALLYLPLNLYNHTLADSGASLLRDIFFNGTFYHLWYFPALALGACIVWALVRGLGRWAWLPAVLLYLIGLLGDSWYGLTAALPPVRAAYEAMFLCFDYTRNGLFSTPIFLLLGGWLAGRPRRGGAGRYGAGLLASLVLLTAEGLLVKHFALARFDALYLTLPLCVGFLLLWLAALELPAAPALRGWTAAIYVLHPWCIVLVRGGARVVGLTGVLVDNSLGHYGAVVLLSALLALPFAFLRPAKADPRGRAWIEVDAAALRHNLSALSALLPEGGKLMPVVKANAYGHGDLAVARICAGEGVRAFAVATAAEGARLRRGGVRGTILVLGCTGPREVPLLARYRLTQAVVSADHARALAAQGRRIAVHLKIDTGLHRLGIPWDDVEGLVAPFACKNLKVTGVFTHLSDAEALDGASQARTLEQLRRLQSAVDGLRKAGFDPGAIHFQGSYGLLNYADSLPCDFARPGIALYGVLSSPDHRTRSAVDLRPVLSLRARVTQLHRLEVGEAAGYDGAFTARRPTVLAALSIGYADGWPRSLSNGAGQVLIRGQRAPIAGLVCMDQLLVDVTDIDGVTPGDIATLIGRDGAAELTAGQAARAAGTITNELLSRLGPRLPRLVTDDTL